MLGVCVKNERLRDFLLGILISGSKYVLECWCILRMVRIVYDLSQQIRVCARMYIGIIWRFGNCRLRHCLDLSQQCQGRVFS